MRHLLPLALIAVACAPTEDAAAPEVDLAGELNLDKELITADEAAAAVSARSLLDVVVEPRLFHLGDPQVAPEPVTRGEACVSDPTVVYEETGCAGLDGWGYAVEITPCEENGDLVGRVFWSTTGLLATIHPSTPQADAEEQAARVLSALGHDRVVRYHVSLQGREGGTAQVCGTYSGSPTRHYKNEVADVDIDGHQARLIWDAEVTRTDDGPGALQTAQGNLRAQFPRGSMVDPYRLEVAGFTREVQAVHPHGGTVVQRGWHGDVLGFIDPETAAHAQIHVERPDFAGMAALPEL